MTSLRILAVSALAAVASCASVELDKRASPLDVKIEMVGNSLVRASVTNTGGSALKLFKTGSILGGDVVEKTEIFSTGTCSGKIVATPAMIADAAGGRLPSRL